MSIHNAERTFRTIAAETRCFPGLASFEALRCNVTSSTPSWLQAHRSLADASVAELLAELEAQMADASSPLRTGNVTSRVKEWTYTTTTMEENPSSADSSAALGLTVVDYQPKGLFGFTSSAWYTTEASGSVNLLIRRDHGTKGVMDIGYVVSGEGTSAASERDEHASSASVRFHDGEVEKGIEIPLFDDEDAEQHFEAFTVKITLLGPIKEGAALRSSAATSRVFVYDYGDGVLLANTAFVASTLPPAVGHADHVDAQQRPSSDRSTASPSGGGMRDFSDIAAGWTITGNGGHGGWVDSHGFGAKDALVGAQEYSENSNQPPPARVPGSESSTLESDAPSVRHNLSIMLESSRCYTRHRSKTRYLNKSPRRLPLSQSCASRVWSKMSQLFRHHTRHSGWQLPSHTSPLSDQS